VYYICTSWFLVVSLFIMLHVRHKVILRRVMCVKHTHTQTRARARACAHTRSRSNRNCILYVFKNDDYACACDRGGDKGISSSKLNTLRTELAGWHGQQQGGGFKCQPHIKVDGPEILLSWYPCPSLLKRAYFKHFLLYPLGVKFRWKVMKALVNCIKSLLFARFTSSNISRK
jgi:hypothetical protein